jgi:hypothetical protein
MEALPSQQSPNGSSDLRGSGGSRQPGAPSVPALSGPSSTPSLGRGPVRCHSLKNKPPLTCALPHPDLIPNLHVPTPPPSLSPPSPTPPQSTTWTSAAA